MNRVTLDFFLKKCEINYTNFSLYTFAKDLTLSEFLSRCDNVDWILELFAKMHPKKLREITLAKAHCANFIADRFMTSPIKNALIIARKFGMKECGSKELKEARKTTSFMAITFLDLTHPDIISSRCGDSLYFQNSIRNARDFNTIYALAASVALCAYDNNKIGIRCIEFIDHLAKIFCISNVESEVEKYKKKTADICRKFLPLKIWNQKKLNKSS